MATQAITFEGATGEPVAARLDLPESTPRGFVLFAHCFTCSKNYKVAVNLGKALNRAGFGLLRFDFTGLGDSGGAFSDTTFTTNLGDLFAARNWLVEHHAAPIALVGHSLGGAAALAVASEMPELSCVATIAAPADVDHVGSLFAGLTFDADGTAEVSIGARPFRVGRQFVEDLSRHDLPARIGQVDIPLLVFHAPHDRVVGIEHAERIFHAARHPKSFISLGESDHLVGDAAAAEMIAGVLVAWLVFSLESKSAT
jgi:esterase/lipase